MQDGSSENIDNKKIMAHMKRNFQKMKVIHQ